MAHHHPTPPDVLVDGAKIPPAEIAAEMQHHPAATAAEAWQQAARAVVLRRLLLAEAGRLAIDDTPQGDETPEEATLRRLLEAELRIPEADEATCRRWFAANPAKFRTRPTWHAAHILFAADPADPAERMTARAAAQVALEEVLANPIRLSDLARTHSACPSREQGGDLGLIAPGSTVAPFEAALRATPAGATHPAVVETRFGFHVLRVLHHAEGRDLPYDAVRARIAAWLREASWRRAAHQYMALLAGRARIEGVAMAASAGTPLVQ